MEKEYYIQANTDKSEQIKYTFEKLGYNIGSWVFTSGLYYTLNGNINITSIGSNEYYLVINNPNYEELKVKNLPKFKVGDWIANDYCAGKVIALTDDAYLLDSGQGIPFSCEHNAHLWTIQDAKDGDVLACSDWLFILKQFNAKGNKHKTYCHYDLTLNRFKDDTDSYMVTGSDEFHPATKEQRDQLFAKMREAGYSWDEKKKELRKIIKPKFKVGDWLWHKTKGVFPVLIAGYDEEKGYLVKYIGSESYFERNATENEYRLWNFEDSKLGDILYDKAYNRIGIFKNFGHHPDGGSFNDKTYCYLIIYYDIDDNELYEETHNDMDSSDAVPATKEQRDLLFQKMKEEGYQWDDVKKELKKIQKHYDISSFHEGMPVLVRDSNDQEWNYLLFSHYRKKMPDHFFAGGYPWYECIPYNKETKHLLGTTNMCEEKYINW